MQNKKMLYFNTVSLFTTRSLTLWMKFSRRIQTALASMLLGCRFWITLLLPQHVCYILTSSWLENLTPTCSGRQLSACKCLTLFPSKTKARSVSQHPTQ